VAVKRTTKAGEYVSREYEVLERLKGCLNCVQMLDIFYSEDDKGKKAQNIVFEFCDTNLEAVIQQHKKNSRFIDIGLIRHFMKQILQGIAYCHKVGVCHRDLKPENILLTEEQIVKICDFGSAKVLSTDGLNTPYIVSRYYRAPELIMGCSDYKNSIDIWAIGCIFAELLTLRPLFPGKTEGSQLLEQIAILGLPKKEDLENISEQLNAQTIETILKVDDMPKQSFDKILPEPYTLSERQQASDLLEKMLRWRPDARVTAEHALRHPFFKS